MNLRLAFLTAALVGSCALAQTPAAPAAATSGAATSNPTTQITCNDGTADNGHTLRRACRKHGGVANKPAQPGASTLGAAAGPAANSAAAVNTGKVWANLRSKVYHCPGDPYYGKTKKGEYMTEGDAKGKGFHADHGKACAA